MPSIRIISAPAGQAPEWVRKEWIGVEIPLKDVPAEQAGTQVGALLGKKSSENEGGYKVDTKQAVDILATKNADAAQWWRENLDFDMLPTLVFGNKFCELIS